jgi:vacuolar-type H+-ATPase subunit I/STV1
MRTSIVVAMILIMTAGAAFSQTDQQQTTENKDLQKSYLYQWTDDKGVAHITDGLGKVPTKYRDKALRLEQPKTEGGDGGQQVQQGTSSPAPEDEEEIEADRKAEWQLRVKEARQRITAAEQRYRELAVKRDDLVAKTGGPATGIREGIVEIDQIEQQMKSVQQEIEDARHYLDVVIPDEARRAGVPPGWLRE